MCTCRAEATDTMQAGCARLTAASAMILTLMLSQRRSAEPPHSLWALRAGLPAWSTSARKVARVANPPTSTHASHPGFILVQRQLLIDELLNNFTCTLGKQTLKESSKKNVQEQPQQKLSRRPKPHRQRGCMTRSARRRPRAGHPASSSCGSASCDAARTARMQPASRTLASRPGGLLVRTHII